MFTSDEIYGMLRDGADDKDLAQSFTDALNAAIKRRNDEDEAEHKEAEKIDWLTDILDQTNEWMEEYYPELINKEDTEDFVKTAKNLIKIMDGMSKTIKAIDKNDEDNVMNGLDGLLKSFNLF